MSEAPVSSNENMSLEELSSMRKSRLQQLRSKRKLGKMPSSTKELQEEPISGKDADHKETDKKDDETNQISGKTNFDQSKSENLEMTEKSVSQEDEGNIITEENNGNDSIEPESKRVKLLKTGGRNYNPITKAPVNSFEMELKLPDGEGTLSIVTNDAEENKIISSLSKKFKVNETDDTEIEEKMKKQNKTNFIFETYKQDLKEYEDELDAQTTKMLKSILKKRILESGQ